MSSPPQVQYALAWGNLQLFDFNKRHLEDKFRLYLWSMPQGMDDLLNPIGTTGTGIGQMSIFYEKYC